MKSKKISVILFTTDTVIKVIEFMMRNVVVIVTHSIQTKIVYIAYLHKQKYSEFGG